MDNGKKRILFATFAIFSIALAGLVILTPDDNGTGYSDAANDDLATILDNAGRGDIIVMSSDMILTRDATVKSEVSLVNNGFKLTIPYGVTLVVYGELSSRNNISIDGTLMMVSDSIGYIDGQMSIFGSFEVLMKSTVYIASKSNTTITCTGNNNVLIEGKMFIGSSLYSANIELRSVTITGNLSLSSASTFKVLSSLTIGSPPITVNEMNNATIIGKFTLTDNTYVRVYGNPEIVKFDQNNITNKVVKTTFIIGVNTYMADYISATGTKTIELPSAKELKDQTVSKWRDIDGNVMSEDNDIRIGTEKYIVIEGEHEPKLYTVTFVGNENIRWLADGTPVGGTGVLEKPYNTNITVDIRPMPGYTDALPELMVNGVAYEPLVPFLIQDNTVFAISTPTPKNGIDIVIVAIAILIAAVAMLIITIMLANSKKKKK